MTSSLGEFLSDFKFVFIKVVITFKFFNFLDFESSNNNVPFVPAFGKVHRPCARSLRVEAYRPDGGGAKSQTTNAKV